MDGDGRPFRCGSDGDGCGGGRGGGIGGAVAAGLRVESGGLRWVPELDDHAAGFLLQATEAGGQDSAALPLLPLQQHRRPQGLQRQHHPGHPDVQALRRLYRPARLRNRHGQRHQ